MYSLADPGVAERVTVRLTSKPPPGTFDSCTGTTMSVPSVTLVGV